MKSGDSMIRRNLTAAEIEEKNFKHHNYDEVVMHKDFNSLERYH